MKCRLVKLERISGSCATLYTILADGEQETQFEHFLSENTISFKNEIIDILKRLNAIGHKTGARHGFFKHDEGKWGDGCCALYDEPNRKLRLYCIRYGTQIVILGGGGLKQVRAWQDDPKLSEQMKQLMALAKELNKRLKEREITYVNEFLEFEGDLEFDI